jgi:hypothetical protein
VANYEIRQSGTTYYNLPTAYYSFLFEYQSPPNETEGSICNFQDTVSGIKSTLHLTLNHQLRFGDLAQWMPTGNTVLSPGQVYTISVKVGTGTSAAWEVRINGKVEMGGTNGNFGANNNGSLELGGNLPYTTNYYYDDVAINSQGYQSGGGASSAALLANQAPPPNAAPTLASSMVVPALPEAQLVQATSSPVLLSTASGAVGGDPQPTQTSQGTVPTTAVDAFFADWDSSLAPQNALA